VTLPAETLDALAGAAGNPGVPKDELFFADDPVVEALGITENEKIRLGEFWRSALRQIRRAEVARSEVRENDDGSVSFRIDPLAGLRSSVRAQFAARVKRELDSDRGAAFLSFKGGGRLFGGGEQPVECRLSIESAGNGRWRFHITRKQGDSRKVWVADAIPPELRHLTDAAGILPRVHDPAGENPDGE